MATVLQHYEVYTVDEKIEDRQKSQRGPELRKLMVVYATR